MKCPECKAPISFIDSRKRLLCKNCGIGLEAKNWGWVVLASLTFLSIFVLPIASMLSEKLIIVFLIEVLIAFPFFAICLKVFLEYTVTANDI